MSNDIVYAERARALLKVRERHHRIFPGALFEDEAWALLLHLFIAHVSGTGMSEVDVVGLESTGRINGQRWLYHLMQDKQIAPRLGGDNVVLTKDALERLRTFLRNEQDPSDPIN